VDFGRTVLSEPYLGWLLAGTGMTIAISLVTSLLALAIGSFVSGLRTSGSRLLRGLAILHVQTFRNLPPVPLVLFLVLGLPGAWPQVFGHDFPKGMELQLLLAGLSLNTSGYVAEILRSGLRGVPPSQWDSCRALGLSPVTTRLRVIYPQALRVCLPALGTRLIHNTKNSTIALVIPLSSGSMEVLGQAGRIAGESFAWAEPLVFAALVHLSLAFALSALVNAAARRAQGKVAVAR